MLGIVGSHPSRCNSHSIVARIAEYFDHLRSDKYVFRCIRPKNIRLLLLHLVTGDPRRIPTELLRNSEDCALESPDSKGVDNGRKFSSPHVDSVDPPIDQLGVYVKPFCKGNCTYAFNLTTLELTRFGGHLMVSFGGVRNGRQECPIYAGI
jgi:hypothetical protein